MKKLAQLYIKPHIYKFIVRHASKYLQYEFDFEKNTLLLKQRIPYLKITNTVHPREYFERLAKDCDYIYVQMENANDNNLYGLSRQLEKDFQHQLLMHMNTSKSIYEEIGLVFCAMDSIRNFLDSHDIREEEYSIGTAYKLWQRYLSKKREKQKMRKAFRPSGRMKAVNR